MLKRNHFLSRREVLGTALGGLFLAPLLRARRLEAAGANPKRLLIAFTPDSHTPEWWPTGSGTNFKLGEPLADFAGLEAQMLFVRRLDHAWTFDNHHEAGMAQLLTGAKFFNDTDRYANGPSIDQILLKNTDIRAGTALGSVHVSAAGGGGADKRHVISYSGPGQPMAHEEDPARAFSNIFSGVTFGGTGPVVPPPSTGDPVAMARQKVRANLLKVNTAELKRLQTYLGQTERTKLDLHVEALAELERRLPAAGGAGGAGGTGSGVPVGGACEKITTTGVGKSDRDAAILMKQAQTQADLIVNAFTCDRTRIADFGLSFSGGHHQGLFGRKESWHDTVAHVSKTNDSIDVGGAAMTSRQAFIKFDRFMGGHIAYLAKRLSLVAEGNGTMLDNTLLLWGVESGTNHNHSPRDMQYLLIGGKNLGFKTGQILDVGTQSSNKMLTSVMNAFGHPATGLGIEPTCGPLTGIL